MMRVIPGALMAATIMVAPARAQDHSIGVGIGMLGAGIEYTYRISERLAFRGAVNGADYSFDAVKSGIGYDFMLDFSSLALGMDFHPNRRALRLSLGLLRNDNLLRARNSPAQTIRIGGTDYFAGDIGTLTGEVTVDETGPYASLGWNWRREKKVGLTLDFGLVSQGEPAVALAVDGPIADDPDFVVDLAGEQAELQNTLDDLDIYPFAMFGIAVRF